MERVLNIVHTSDWHVGITKISPASLCDHIKTCLFPVLNDDIDVLILAGDLWHTLIDLNARAAPEAIELVGSIINIVKKHNIILRVLKGTFSHDRNQSRIFSSYNDILDQYGNSLIDYIDTVKVEKIAGLDISILYAPDDLMYKDVIEVFENRVKEAGITSVDIFINHGYWEHLLPKGIPHTPANTLVIKTMKRYVHGFAINGHVHSANVNGFVINNGSIDRLNHGEEEDKGFFITKYNTMTHETRQQFIVNHNATTFKTYDYRSLDLDSAIRKLPTDLSKHGLRNEREFLRFLVDSPQIRSALHNYVSTTVDHNVMEVTFDTKGVEQVEEPKGIRVITKLPEITESNIISRMIDHINLHNKDTLGINEAYIEKQLRGE